MHRFSCFLFCLNFRFKVYISHRFVHLSLQMFKFGISRGFSIRLFGCLSLIFLADFPIVALDV